MGIPIKWPLVITLCQIFSNEQWERSVQHLCCGNQWWRLSEITDFANVIFHISEDDFDWIYLLSDNQYGCTYSSHLTKLLTQSTEKYQYFCKYNQHNSQTSPITLTSNLLIHAQVFSSIKAYGDPMTALGVLLLRLDLFFCVMKVLLNLPIYILYQFFLVFKISCLLSFSRKHLWSWGIYRTPLWCLYCNEPCSCVSIKDRFLFSRSKQ